MITCPPCPFSLLCNARFSERWALSPLSHIPLTVLHTTLVSMITETHIIKVFILLYLNLVVISSPFRASLCYLTPGHALLPHVQCPWIFCLPLPGFSTSALLPFHVGDPQGAVFSSSLCTTTTLPEHPHPPHSYGLSLPESDDATT